jgi:Na+-transporting methylmalonyl-CoA/oxaloacetate decarboxylase gamma subunit
LELRTIDYIAGVGFILVALFVVAFSLYEVGSARSDPDTYERVYYPMTAEEYVADQYRAAALYAVALALPVLLFLDRKRRRVWRVLVLGVAAVWIVAVAYGYWAWAESGFDH